MTTIRWQERVHRPYQSVSQAFEESASDIIKWATCAAVNQSQKEELVADLHTKVAGIEFHRDVIVLVKSCEERKSESQQRLVVELEWRSIESANLFPIMHAKLFIIPIGGETQLDFRGEYVPPLGLIGQAIDVVVGERIAESSVKHFISEIAGRLHTIIPSAYQHCVS
jgi:hypothetical protein